jgi:hypothetical protein
MRHSNLACDSRNFGAQILPISNCHPTESTVAKLDNNRTTRVYINDQQTVSHLQTALGSSDLAKKQQTVAHLATQLGGSQSSPQSGAGSNSGAQSNQGSQSTEKK